MRRALSMLLMMMVACATTSPVEVEHAKTAEYNLATNQLLDVAMQVAQRKYQVRDVDMQESAFNTVPQWYSADGMRRGTANEGNGDYIVNSMGGDIRLSLEVDVVPGPGGKTIVHVTHHTFQLVAGSPQPRELADNDPYVPPWVHGRVDQLALDIYNAAKTYAQ